MLRPNWLDHPNFTGSNPEFALIAGDTRDNVATPNRADRLARMVYGPWDVDNDNDGVRDSVWVDFGASVMLGPNGKLVKPLAAILCIDMDGRLNVNAHGTLDLAKAVPDVQHRDLLADGTTEVDDIARGSGFGPADISLEPVIGDDFAALLRGQTYRINGQDRVYPGRYGAVEPFVNYAANRVRPGRLNWDLLSQIAPRRLAPPRRQPLPLRHPARPPRPLQRRPERLRPARLGSHPHRRARPHRPNKPVTPMIGSATSSTTTPTSSTSPTSTPAAGPTPGGRDGVPGTADETSSNTPPSLIGADYAGPAAGTAADAPFSLAELERTLRIFDEDASRLPDRLARLAGIIYGNDPPSRIRRLPLTPTASPTSPTASASPPTASTSRRQTSPSPTKWSRCSPPTPKLRRLPRSVAELIEIRVRQALWPVSLLSNPRYPGAIR